MLYRFAMVYDKYNSINTEIAFLSLDPDRINEEITGGKFTDLGDDILLNSSSNDICSGLNLFLRSNFNDK
jgi:hypothetical protein